MSKLCPHCQQVTDDWTPKHQTWCRACMRECNTRVIRNLRKDWRTFGKQYTKTEQRLAHRAKWAAIAEKARG